VYIFLFSPLSLSQLPKSLFLARRECESSGVASESRASSWVLGTGGGGGGGGGELGDPGPSPGPSPSVLPGWLRLVDSAANFKII